MRLTLSAILAICLAPQAFAQAIAPQPQHWSVAPAFARGAEARENISGAACAATQPPLRSCFAVNDQKKYAQFFSIAGNTIVPGAVMRLLGDNADSDPDTEGAAFDRGYFYAVGSHGVARKSAKEKNAPFTVFRFKVNEKDGKPAFEVSESQASPRIERSTALRAVIRKAEGIGPFAEKPLSENGANIEGLAVDGARLYVGFRGPVVDGRAFILSAAVEGMFGAAPLDARTHALALGPETGIRDLARVEEGILVLTGAVNNQNVTPSVYLWSPSSGGLKKLGELAGTPSGAKAETLLVLGQEPQRTRVLVMYDGPANGAPMEYWLPR